MNKELNKFYKIYSKMLSNIQMRTVEYGYQQKIRMKILLNFQLRIQVEELMILTQIILDNYCAMIWYLLKKFLKGLQDWALDY